MPLELVKIPDLRTEIEEKRDVWKIRVLEINGNAPALVALTSWEKSEKADYKKIIKVMTLAVQQKKVRNEKHVKSCANSNYPGVYEFRADKGNARMMFFYDEEFETAIICTNDFFGKGGSIQKQDTAFANCHAMKMFYEKEKRNGK